MLRDASQRGGPAEGCVFALRCDAPQHEGAAQLAERSQWPKHQPGAVGNSRRRGSVVSGLLFTM